MTGATSFLRSCHFDLNCYTGKIAYVIPPFPLFVAIYLACLVLDTGTPWTDMAGNGWRWTLSNYHLWLGGKSRARYGVPNSGCLFPLFCECYPKKIISHRSSCSLYRIKDQIPMFLSY